MPFLALASMASMMSSLAPGPPRWRALGKMTIGARIRRHRNEGGMTQREIADEVGLTESAIRNYERGIRTSGDQRIGRIAEALDVSADSIREIGVSGVRGALEVLFRYERELGLMPVVTGDGVAVAPDPKEEGSQKAAQALKAWKRMRDQLAAGEIDEDDYEAWKARFRG
ncbi:helix-turn-helix domain-containing protein [Collinsella sp. AM17-1]|uniref:helix-turn-helix domain-containing protein n=1 Tax=Collinsella sp. AM17-1 TaxID=2292027 RepID=UPI003514D57A